MSRYRTWVDDSTPPINANNLNAIEDRLPYISVKDKSLSGGGAVGDGTTDDTTSIQAAITAAGALNPQAKVYFPRGIYKITAPLDFPESSEGTFGATVELQGEGQGASVIKQFTDNTPILRVNTHNLHSGAVRDLGLSYSSAQTGSQAYAFQHTGTSAKDLYQWVFERVRVVNAYIAFGINAAAAQVLPIWGFAFRDLDIEDAYKHAFLLDSPSDIGLPRILLENIYINNQNRPGTDYAIKAIACDELVLVEVDIEYWDGPILYTDGSTKPLTAIGTHIENHDITTAQSMFACLSGGIFLTTSIQATVNHASGETTLFEVYEDNKMLLIEGIGVNVDVTTGDVALMKGQTLNTLRCNGYIRQGTGTLTAPIRPGHAGSVAALREYNTVFYNPHIAAANNLVFDGDGYIELEEQADPASAPSNKARLFSKDNGSGKTQLAVIFPTGAVQVIATEP